MEKSQLENVIVVIHANETCLMAFHVREQADRASLTLLTYMSVFLCIDAVSVQFWGGKSLAMLPWLRFIIIFHDY